MYEVEIKIPASVDAIRERLADAGADRRGRRRQRDVYYDAPHRVFAETDEALRIRHETDDAGASNDTSTHLTYKGPRLDEASKTRVEHETAVAEATELADVLDCLGFEPAATVEKRREYWTLEGFTITLDAVSEVGEFVEIERAVENQDAIDETREAAVETLAQLGLDVDDQVTTSYLGLLLDGD